MSQAFARTRLLPAVRANTSLACVLVDDELQAAVDDALEHR
jgi:hypothetical protein